MYCPTDARPGGFRSTVFRPGSVPTKAAPVSTPKTMVGYRRLGSLRRPNHRHTRKSGDGNPDDRGEAKPRRQPRRHLAEGKKGSGIKSKAEGLSVAPRRPDVYRTVLHRRVRHFVLLYLHRKRIFRFHQSLCTLADAFQPPDVRSILLRSGMATDRRDGIERPRETRSPRPAKDCSRPSIEHRGRQTNQEPPYQSGHHY